MSPIKGEGVGVPISAPGAPVTVFTPCGRRYAEAWQYAAFFCASGYAHGYDSGGVANSPSLTDAGANFVHTGVRAGVGMLLYNVTKSTSGPVTDVTQTTLTATGVTWDDGDEYRIAAIDQSEIATIEMYLDITAADINAAIAATGACECDWQEWVWAYLAKLNIIEAGAFHTCSCGSTRLSDEVKMNMLRWADEQLTLLRDGKVILCEGDTGGSVPAVDWAEVGASEFSQARIITNRYLRRG